tara:strand:- start:148 stop:450 length:303 start_codon:yes stop_codon:yes gene_type:complete
MATEFVDKQWRIPNSWNVDESNQGKISNYSMKFNGSSDFIDIANGSTIARGQEISYSVWANLDSFTGDIIGNKTSSNRGTGLNFTSGNLIFQLGDGSNDS